MDVASNVMVDLGLLRRWGGEIVSFIFLRGKSQGTFANVTRRFLDIEKTYGRE